MSQCMKFYLNLLCSFCFVFISMHFSLSGIQLGVERLFSKEYEGLLRYEKVAIVTNHTAIDSCGNSTIDLFRQNRERLQFEIVAYFAPEHGLKGSKHAGKNVSHEVGKDGVPIYSLHGETRRPTKEMLKGVTLIVYDIQDIGSRSYTFTSTLFYVMEEAALAKIPIWVLDRPNPLGAVVDGPILEDKWRSFVGYINVPYCHGLTVGELAQYFNGEYHIGCRLKVIPMLGWKRWMTFRDTGLTWIPTSPQVPDADTPFFYPTTGILGELNVVNIGVGYTLPFKVVGAPWIDADLFAKRLNEQKLPGVRFHPFHYIPFFGGFAKQNCEGVLIVITHPSLYLPVTVQYTLMGVLKALYPKEFQKGLGAEDAAHIEMFHKVNGTDDVFRILKNEPYVTWKLRALHQNERAQYMIRRTPYMIPQYQ